MPDPTKPDRDVEPPGARRNRRRAQAPQSRAEAHDDSPLESIGKAVSAPVRETADPQSDEKPQD